MNTIVKPIPHTVDLNEPVKKTYIDTLLATEDNLAHRFDITIKKGGEAVTLPDGTAVTAYFIRYSDNATISLTGTVSGNVASVTLNKSCYNKAGQYAIIIKLVADGVTNTVFYGEGTIFTSMTDTILDPENVVPSLSDLLAQIAVMEEATAATKAATTNAKSATTRANNAAAKIEGMTASAVDAEEAGVTVSEVDGVKHFAFELPKGPKGDPGTIENVTITSINGLTEALEGKLGTNETASDSAKLDGKAASNYLTTDKVVNNFTTTEAGFVADARTVKELNDKMNSGLKTFGMMANQKMDIQFSNQLFGGMALLIRRQKKSALKLYAFSGSEFNETSLCDTMDYPVVSADYTNWIVTITGDASTHVGVVLYGALNNYYLSHTVSAI